MSGTYKGLFIAFEGGEGSGKTTQAALLRDGLAAHGVETYLTREPGDTLIGKHIRGFLLDGNAGAITTKTEMLLFAADRAEHVETVLKPKLEAGQVVICDRYSASTMAYQVFAGGLDRDGVQSVSDWASDGLKPDITFLLDVDPMIGLDRAGKMNGKDRYESEDLAYHDKVRKGFLEQKDDSWVVLAGNRSENELHDKILDHVLHVLHVIQRFSAGVYSEDEVEVRFLSGFSSKVSTYPSTALCRKEICHNPNHAYGHAINDPADTYENSLQKMERLTAGLIGSPTMHPITDTGDLADVAQAMVQTTVGECGFDECVNHPPKLKVIK